MRTLLYQTIIADALIVGISGATLGGVGQARVYQAGALGVGHTPAKPPRPFMLLSELPALSYPIVRDTLPAAKSRYFQVWVYDDRGDMSSIDKVLTAVETRLNNKLDGLTSASGARCVSSAIQGISQDIVDPEFDLSTRFLTLRLTSNR